VITLGFIQTTIMEMGQPASVGLTCRRMRVRLTAWSTACRSIIAHRRQAGLFE